MESKAVEEPLNSIPLSSTNSSAGSIALSLSETVSVPEHISQFMGFQADFPVPDDPFGFSLDPPFFLGHASDVDTHYSWKSDEFLLSIMRDSMYV